MNKPIITGLVVLSMLAAGFQARAAAEDEDRLRRQGCPAARKEVPGLPFRGRSQGEARPLAAKQAFAGGESGKAIVPGKPEESLLWERVCVRRNAAEVAAAPRTRRRCSESGSPQARAGAPIRSTPSRRPRRAGPAATGGRFSRSARPAVPPVRHGGWVRTPIDRFILKKLEANGLSPTPEADRRVLIRRVCFDLTGLPPEPEEIDAFLDDQSPGGLREDGRPLPGLAAVRRPLGAVVARPGPLRREQRIRVR